MDQDQSILIDMLDELLVQTKEIIEFAFSSEEAAVLSDMDNTQGVPIIMSVQDHLLVLANILNKDNNWQDELLEMQMKLNREDPANAA